MSTARARAHTHTHTHTRTHAHTHTHTHTPCPFRLLLSPFTPTYLQSPPTSIPTHTHSMQRHWRATNPIAHQPHVPKWFPNIILQHHRGHRTETNPGHHPEKLSDLLPKLEMAHSLNSSHEIIFLSTHSFIELALFQALDWVPETTQSVRFHLP